MTMEKRLLVQVGDKVFTHFDCYDFRDTDAPQMARDFLDREHPGWRAAIVSIIKYKHGALHDAKRIDISNDGQQKT